MRGLRWGTALVLAAAVAACDGASSLTGGRVLNGAGGAGSIRGTVTLDGAGAAGINVVAQGTTSDTAATGADGTFRFAELSSGSYTVTVLVPLGYRMAPGTENARSLTVPGNGVTTASFALVRTP